MNPFANVPADVLRMIYADVYASGVEAGRKLQLEQKFECGVTHAEVLQIFEGELMDTTTRCEVCRKISIYLPNLDEMLCGKPTERCSCGRTVCKYCRNDKNREKCDECFDECESCGEKLTLCLGSIECRKSACGACENRCDDCGDVICNDCADHIFMCEHNTLCEICIPCVECKLAEHKLAFANALAEIRGQN